MMYKGYNERGFLRSKGLGIYNLVFVIKSNIFVKLA